MKRIVLLLAVVCMSGCATLRDVYEWTKEVEPTPEAPAPSDDAVPFGNLRWNRGGENFSGAVRDTRVTLTTAVIHAGGTPTMAYAGTGLTVWPTRSENINAITSIFFDEDGDGVYERGGKFDWGRSNAAPRPMQHLNHGYSNWDGYPARGTPWAFVMTDQSGRQRSNVRKGVWP